MFKEWAVLQNSYLSLETLQSEWIPTELKATPQMCFPPHESCAYIGNGSITYMEVFLFLLLNGKICHQPEKHDLPALTHTRLNNFRTFHNKFGSCSTQCQDPGVHWSLSFTSSSIILCFKCILWWNKWLLGSIFLLTYINISLLALSLWGWQFGLCVCVWDGSWQRLIKG